MLYGRAGILNANYQGKTIGAVDIKGFGNMDGMAGHQITNYERSKNNSELLDALRTSGHSDGLMSHGEAIAEVTRQTAIQRLFDIHNSKKQTDFETVESYFIIKLPFEILKDGNKRDRAALYGRQAHFSRKNVEGRVPDGIYRDPQGGTQGTGFGGHNSVVQLIANREENGHCRLKNQTKFQRSIYSTDELVRQPAKELRVGKINALFRRQEKYCWVSRVVNHASLGPESGNFRALHRPEVPNFGTVCRLARVRAKEEGRLREVNRIEWGIGLGSGHVHYR
jgi:hypothetical protein